MAKLRKFKILVIQHLLKNNRLANSGDIVDETKFINLEDSLKGKYIEEVFEDKKKSKDKNKDKGKKSPEKDDSNTDLGQGSSDDSGDDSDLKKVKKMNKESLIAYATDNEIEFDAEANKATILATIVKHLEKG